MAAVVAAEPHPKTRQRGAVAIRFITAGAQPAAQLAAAVVEPDSLAQFQAQVPAVVEVAVMAAVVVAGRLVPPEPLGLFALNGGCRHVDHRKPRWNIFRPRKPFKL